jgi:hydrogenase/urease accessory protein HupE
MHQAVYVLCAMTSVFCAGLLARRYRQSRTPLLRWSMWCFVALAVNNVLLVVDLIALPQIDLSIARDATASVALALLLIGLIREVR